MNELDSEIAKLEESMRRMDECEDDEIDNDEYEATLKRLVALREKRESRKIEYAKIERSKELQLERIEELKSLGIDARPAFGVMGSITIGATSAAKLIRLLKRNRATRKENDKRLGND